MAYNIFAWHFFLMLLWTMHANAMQMVTKELKKLSFNDPEVHPLLFQLSQITPAQLTIENKKQIEEAINKHNVNVNILDAKKRNALHYAIQYKHNIIPLLMSLSIGINSKNENGDTPLHFACAFKNEHAVACLLQSPDTNINEKNNNEQTPLHLAAMSSNPKIIKLFINDDHLEIPQQDKFKSTPFDYALTTEKFDRKIVDLFLTRYSINNQNIHGFTPLHIACQQQSKRLVNYLLAHKELDINKVDNNGNTALHTAIETKNSGIVSLLLNNAKVNPNIQNKEFLTPLMIAVRNQQYELVQLLTTYNSVDLDCRSNDTKRNALYIAYALGNNEIFKLLIGAGSDTNTPDIQQETIEILLSKNQKKTLRGLWQKNKNAKEIIHDMKDYFLQHEKLFKAINTGDKNGIKRMAITMNLNRHDKGEYKDTPLHQAVRKNNKELCALLLSLNLGLIDQKNKQGLTPLMLMLKEKHFDLFKYFFEKISHSYKNTGIDLELKNNLIGMITVLIPEVSIYLSGTRAITNFEPNTPIELFLRASAPLDDLVMDKLQRIVHILQDDAPIILHDYHNYTKEIQNKVTAQGIVWHPIKDD